MTGISSNYNINNVGGLSNVAPLTTATTKEAKNSPTPSSFAPIFERFGSSNLIKFSTKLNESEKKMYVEILEALLTKGSSRDLHNYPNNISPAKKLDTLLKNGKLLDRDSNNGSSALENLYKMVKTPRLHNMDSAKLLCETISALYKPSISTQKFGKISPNNKAAILNSPHVSEAVRKNPNLMDVDASSTCPSASLEFHLANKHPAEFARWAESLSSEKGSVEQTVKLSALSESPMDAIWLLEAFGLAPKKFSFTEPVFDLKPDKNAYKRALIQQDNWVPGERTMVDVLIQSTLMQIGSQQSYDTLTDTRGGKFSNNPQGLIEFEKTFIESILANKEKFSVIYQDLSPEQYLIGHKTDFSVIDRHIKGALKDGEDVIVGYIKTRADGKIKMAHEITIVDAKVDKDGKTIYVCNDTDDDNPELIEYRADYLLPKIHHGGFSKHIVEKELPYLSAA